MAYPQLITADTFSLANGTPALTRTVTMPSNLTAGDLIVLVYHSQDTGGGTNVNMTTNLGTFTRVLNDSVPTTTNKYAVFWKWSNGTESSQTATISHSSGATINLSIFSSYRITGSHYSKTPIFVAASGLTVYDPSSVTAPWGSNENLFISILSQARNGPPTLTSYPTNYTNGTNHRSGSIGIIAQATRQLASATDDPAAFVVSGAAGGFANFTIVVGPAPAVSITSINGGSSIRFGQTGISLALAGFSGTPTNVTATYANGTKTLTCSNVTGNAAAITFDLEDRIDGAEYPMDGDTVRFTVTYVDESAYMDAVVIRQLGEVKQTFVLPIFDDEDYFGYVFAQLGFTVESAEFNYIPFGDFVLRPDSGFSTTSAGEVNGWFRPLVGLGAGNVYYYQMEISTLGVVTINLSSIFTQSESPKYDGSYFAIDRP